MMPKPCTCAQKEKELSEVPRARRVRDRRLVPPARHLPIGSISSSLIKGKRKRITGKWEGLHRQKKKTHGQQLIAEVKNAMHAILGPCI